MKYLGIDYGARRIGLAVGTSEDSIAFPREVIIRNKDVVKTISEYIEKEGIDEIVVGESLNLNGERNAIQDDIDEFIGDLTLETGLPIHLEQEFLTSYQAQKIQGKHKKIDASAASIILQTYLEKLKHI